jgi:hypothetical protein
MMDDTSPWEAFQPAGPREAVEGDPWDQFKLMEKSALSQSRSRQDQMLQMIEEQPDIAGSQERQEEFLRGIEEDAAAQKAVFDQIMTDSAESGLMEQSRQLQDDYLMELDEQRRILSSILNQASAGPQAQLQMAAERQLMERSRARQDEILNALKAKKPKPRPKRTVPRGTNLKQLEQQLRDIRKRERIAGQLSAEAADRRDQAAWERSGKILDRLFDEREQIRKGIQKIDPKREQELYDELYTR